MLFYEGKFHICVPSHPLALNEGIQFLVVQGLHRLLFHIEVVHCQCDYSVQLGSTAYAVREVLVIVPDYIFFQFPSLE